MDPLVLLLDTTIVTTTKVYDHIYFLLIVVLTYRKQVLWYLRQLEIVFSASPLAS